ncbi:MAG: 7-carboxy-7-deazaguanine synthase QueE [Acidobacteriota bacterium]
MLKVNEIFWSVQGEGLRSGEPSIFLRLSGCNLRCYFCDTKYAWEDGTLLPEADIIKRIRKLKEKYKTSWVVITGGEPFSQHISSLLKKLKQKKYFIQIETNGTLVNQSSPNLKSLPESRKNMSVNEDKISKNLSVFSYLDWITISPKPPEYRFKKVFSKLTKEVKLIVTKELSLEVIKKMRNSFPQKTPLILQPQSNLKWSLKKALKLIEDASKSGIRNVHLGLQFQKIYSIK